MSGGEIVAASKAIELVGKKALGQDQDLKKAMIETAVDSPEMRAAGRAMAARAAVKEQIKLKLFRPIAWIFQVNATYFDDRLSEELAAKATDIPAESLTSPAPSVAMPALQGLSYSVDEPTLKELYLNLLITAMDGRRSGEAHPAFVEVIRQLSADEVLLLELFLKADALPIARVTHKLEDGAFYTLRNNLVNVTRDGEPDTDPRIAVWIDNWVRLGLAHLSYTEWAKGGDPDPYSWVKERPEFRELQLKANSESGTLDFKKGFLRVTDFGRQFKRAVSNDVPASPSSDDVQPAPPQ